ncbi:MAG: hypothetical protein U9N81_06690 [Bacillota bacterium]|nr:hypothetical protein [Bacillota bacterium]
MNWEPREQNLRNRVLFIHFFCMLILLGAVIQYFNSMNLPVQSLEYMKNHLGIGILLLAEAIFLLLFHNNFFLSGRKMQVVIGILYPGFPFVVGVVILWLMGNSISYAGTLLLLPVLVAGTIAGKNAIYCWTGASAVALVLYDLMNHQLQVNLINVVGDQGILLLTIFLAGWFSASVAEMERGWDWPYVIALLIGIMQP